MPGSGHKFSLKDDRQIAHIKASEEARGMDSKRASSIAYGALVNQKKRKAKPAWHQAMKKTLRSK